MICRPRSLFVLEVLRKADEVKALTVDEVNRIVSRLQDVGKDFDMCYSLACKYYRDGETLSECVRKAKEDIL